MPTRVAYPPKVEVNRTTGFVTVQKLTIVPDSGTLVDPNGARAQTQGGVLSGLSMALHKGVAFADGQVTDTNLDTCAPLWIGDVPGMAISFIDSIEIPVVLGEPATTVVGPAIGNAIYAALGIRLRHLPIRADAFLAPLSAKNITYRPE